MIVDPMEDLIWVNDEEQPVARLWVFPGHEDDFQREPAWSLVMSIIETGLGVLWDMAPNKDGQQLGILLRRNKEGVLEMSPPTLQSHVEMSVGERFWRARSLTP